MFAWSEKYSVGNPDIDAEHQALFRLAAELQAAVESGRAQEELAGIFARLSAYTQFHFAGEEERMRRSHFAGLAAHAREHKQLTGRLSELEHAFIEGKSRVDRTTLQFLERWLSHHVVRSDRSVGEHFSG